MATPYLIATDLQAGTPSDIVDVSAQHAHSYSGALYVVGFDGSTIAAHKSTNGGVTWAGCGGTGPAVGLTGDGSGEAYYSVARAGNTLWVAWVDQFHSVWVSAPFYDYDRYYSSKLAPFDLDAETWGTAQSVPGKISANDIELHVAGKDPNTVTMVYRHEKTWSMTDITEDYWVYVDCVGGTMGSTVQFKSLDYSLDRFTTGMYTPDGVLHMLFQSGAGYHAYDCLPKSAGALTLIDGTAYEGLMVASTADSSMHTVLKAGTQPHYAAKATTSWSAEAITTATNYPALSDRLSLYVTSGGVPTVYYPAPGNNIYSVSRASSVWGVETLVATLPDPIIGIWPSPTDGGLVVATLRAGTWGYESRGYDLYYIPAGASIGPAARYHAM